KQLALIDCTVVPGSGRIVVEESDCKLLAIRSILGQIRVAAPVEIDLIECMIDSGGADAPAICDPAGAPGGILWSERATIVGDATLLSFDEASSSVFATRPDRTNLGPPVSAERLQS